MIIGIMLMGMGKALGQSLAVVGVVLFALATLFTLVTVPVEFDASARAKKALARMEVVDHAGIFCCFLLKKRYLYKKKNLFWGAKNGIPKYRY